MMKSIFYTTKKYFIYITQNFLYNEKHFSTRWPIFLLHDDEYFLRYRYEKIFYTFKNILYKMKSIFLLDEENLHHEEYYCYIVKKFYDMMKNIFLCNEKHSFLHYEKYLLTLRKIFYRDNWKYENYFSTLWKIFFYTR